MLFHATEVDVELMKMLQKGSKRRTLGHLGKSVDILGEALATITELAIGTGDVSMGVVDVAGEENASVHFTPVGSHLLAVFTARIKIRDLVGSEHIVHILGQLSLQRGHHREFLTHENLGEEIVCSSEHHSLFLEVLDEGAFGEELGHIAHLVAGLAREHLASAGQDGGAHEDGHIGQVGDEFLHQREVLRAIVLGRHVDLQESDINITQVIIVAFGRVADEQFALRIVVFQSIFEGSTDESTSDNSNVNHVFLFLVYNLISKIDLESSIWTYRRNLSC